MPDVNTGIKTLGLWALIVVAFAESAFSPYHQMSCWFLLFWGRLALQQAVVPLVGISAGLYGGECCWWSPGLCYWRFADG